MKMTLVLTGLVLGFAALLTTWISMGIAPLELGALYLVESGLAFALYGFDKSAAEKGGWRRSESALHFLGLMGGWPGALLGQRAFDHKTKKQPFQFFFWTTVLANCVGLVWLVFADGAAGFRRALGIG